MLCLCDKDDDVDVYKDFAQLIRRKEFEEPILLIDNDSTKKIKEYMQLLIDIKLIDTKYHLYYGEVKIVINSFLNYYSSVIDDVIIHADAYSNVVIKDELIILVENTITTQQAKQVEFANGFLPVKTPWEKRMYGEIESEYEEYMKKLVALKEFIYCRLDKQFKVDDFAKKHFPVVVKQMSVLFDTAHLYIGKMLVDKIRNTRLSLEEILRRLRNNLAAVVDERDEYVTRLRAKLYDLNKESMKVTREDNRNSLAMAEASRGIANIKSKIESYEMDAPIERLKKELKYWSAKMEYFNEISANLEQLHAMQEQAAQEHGNLDQLKCEEIPGCKQECVKQFHTAYHRRREEIRLRIINETRALLTFYAVRGNDRIFYTDYIGPYYVDEYNHQNYFFDYGLGVYHVNCDGEFKMFPEYAYLFDKYGRYIEKDGEKLYQCAPCSSQYKLNETKYLDKVTQDCGHSEHATKRCHMDIRDPKDVAILPDFDPMDIKRTLDTDTVRYLWDSFGTVLPEALNDVGQTKPKNPIHYLAHKLLHHKHRMTRAELEKKKKEAEQYRSNIFKERKEKAEAASRLWKSKQVKRRKPEESDDSEFRAYLDARLAQDLFIQALNMDL